MKAKFTKENFSITKTYATQLKLKKQFSGR